MALGDGFAEALKARGGNDFAAMFGTVFDDLYERLRDDVIAEVRAEVQRAGFEQMVAALRNLQPPVVNVPAPQVHVAAPNVTVEPSIDVMPADVVVNVPPVATNTIIDQPRAMRIVRDKDGKIIGAEPIDQTRRTTR
jgi:hypothetical protein